MRQKTIQQELETLAINRPINLQRRTDNHLKKREIDALKKPLAAGAKAYRWTKENLPVQVAQEATLLQEFIRSDAVFHAETENLHEIFGAITAQRPSDYNLEMADFFIPRILEVTNAKLNALENASLEEQVTGLAAIIAESSKAYPASTSVLYPHLDLEKNLVLDFIERHPEISKAENFAADLAPEEISELKKRSLLYSIVAKVPTAYSLDIINSLVSKSRNLSNRPDLMEVMIADHTISSDPDMSQTFDLLVQKGIPRPSDTLVKKMTDHFRLKSGANASKLAKSFLYHRNDVEMIGQVLSLSIRNEERRDLEEFLKNEGFRNPDILLRNIECLVRLNNDELLRQLVDKTKGGERLLTPFLANWPDHNSPLSLAASHKLIKTYEILINAGFDPLRHQEGATNSFAVACKTQGKATLEPFLQACSHTGRIAARKVVTEIDGDGKSALDHVIEGETAYLEVVNFLLNNGAEIEKKHLTAAAIRGHAGVFDLLLRKKFLTEDRIYEICDVVRDHGNYVISSIYIDYLERLGSEKSEELKTALHTKELVFTARDLFDICENSGEKTLQYYLKARPDYDLSSEINNRDAFNRTALHCAISGRAFGNLVKFLIDNGANPNQVGQVSGEEIDAATLAIKHIQPKTLRVILSSDRLSPENPLGLSPESITRSAEELVKHNEAVLTDSFIGGLSVEEINGLDLEIRKTLFARSMQTENLETISKMQIAIRIGDEHLQEYVAEVFLQAIEGSNVKLVQDLVTTFKIQELLRESPKSSSASLEDITLEEVSSPTNSASRASSQSLLKMDVRSVNIDPKYMDTALLVSRRTSSSEAREVEQILSSASFQSSKSGYKGR